MKSALSTSEEFPVVGIGASAGGLDAFKKLIKAIPENPGMAFVLVQHLDPNHESILPELLQKVTPLPVLEIPDAIKMVPDHIYIIPSNKLLVVNDGTLMLTPRPAANKNKRNLPIDLFFTSLAEVYQTRSIGIVLSGSASDGTAGLKAIKANGGITIAQDEKSAEYDGMPNSAITAGVVDFILLPEEIPQKLIEITKITIGIEDEKALLSENAEAIKKILALLLVRKGADFTYYKQPTIRRRIIRRMALKKVEALADYYQFLRENKEEQDSLYHDLLIPVTEFFRDKKSFDTLKENVLKLLFKNKRPGDPIRIWVAGCSTGEEAYSIAMCIKEYPGSAKERVQIFATDISELNITKARSGNYKKSDVENLSLQRINESFIRKNGGYQIKKELKDMCVFAVHNFLKDPPFSKIDLVSCRNVLIYFEPYLQNKALTAFHYSLNQTGFLLLGKSESVNSASDLFISADLNEKLFLRKNIPSKLIYTQQKKLEENTKTQQPNEKSPEGGTDVQKVADDIIFNQYTPPGVVINELFDIVYFHGKTSRFLVQSPGKATHNLYKLANHSLAFELRNILHKVKKEKGKVRRDNIAINDNENSYHISIEAIPLKTVDPHYLILFEEVRIQDEVVSTKSKSHEKDVRIKQLEQELLQTHEDMRGISEEQEATNEELQSTNEELLSSSEELQSLNEELETGKEELQSTNEELTVLNQELISLNEQILEARDFAEAIIGTLHDSLLILDKDLRVISANTQFYEIFKVTKEETEGTLLYDLGNRQWNIPALRKLLEEILPRRTQFLDCEVYHKFPGIGERIMLLNGRELVNRHNSEKLILLAISDVTEIRKKTLLLQEKERALLQAQIDTGEKNSIVLANADNYLRNVFMQVPVSIVVYKGPSFMIDMINEKGLEMWGLPYEKVVNKPLFEVSPELQKDLEKILTKVYMTGDPYIGKEISAQYKREGKLMDGFMDLTIHPVRDLNGTIIGLTAIGTEVTPELKARERNEKRK